MSARGAYRIGVRELTQVKDNLACVGVNLASAHVGRLNAVSRIEMDFPHDFFAVDMVRSLSSGGMRDQIDARPWGLCHWIAFGTDDFLYREAVAHQSRVAFRALPEPDQPHFSYPVRVISTRGPNARF